MRKGGPTMRYRIAWGDLDPLGIVFYPRYYEWMDEAAHLFFETKGIDLEGLLRQRGIIFALVETGCRYFRPARYHDEIEVFTRLEELSKRTLTLRYEIRSGGGDLLAEGFERRICVKKADQTLQATEIPPDISLALAEGG